MMKVSIITATYNSDATLIDTLLSIEKQNYQDIEYIIVDGASTDNTILIINNNSTRVSKIISEVDKGMYDALNKGISMATGDIIGFLHSDDLFAYPDAISEVVETFRENECDAVYGDLEYVSKQDVSHVIRYWRSGSYSKRKVKFGWMPPHPTFYMKRELYHSLGLFDLSFKISADYDSLVRYIDKNNVSLAYLPKVITKMRVGGLSNRSLFNIILKTKEDVQIMKANGFFWPMALLYKNFSKLPQFFK